MIEEITFRDRDFVVTEYLQTDALLINTKIGPKMMHQILVDNKISVSMLYKSVFDVMRLSY